MSKTIWFDMDGTIADFYAVDNWLNKIIHNDTSPYAEALPMFDENEMNFLISALKEKGYEIGIISYAPHNCDLTMLMMTETVKREWLEKFFPYAEKIHITQHTIPKYKWYNDGDILVDDEIGNRIDWMEQGGESVANYRMLFNFI